MSKKTLATPNPTSIQKRVRVCRSNEDRVLPKTCVPFVARFHSVKNLREVKT